MKIVERLSDCGAATSQIDALESRVGATLPSDYRRFLMDTNGGRPLPNGCEGPNGDCSAVSWFFTLNQEEPIYFIPNVIESYNERIPPQLLPIGSDPFGNAFLLDLGAKSVGAIYFWDHENENMEGAPWWDNIAFIAPSFTEFIESLH